MFSSPHFTKWSSYRLEGVSDVFLIIIFLMLPEKFWFHYRNKAGNKEFLKKDHLALELLEEKSFPSWITECNVRTSVTEIYLRS